MKLLKSSVKSLKIAVRDARICTGLHVHGNVTDACGDRPALFGESYFRVVISLSFVVVGLDIADLLKSLYLAGNKRAVDHALGGKLGRRHSLGMAKELIDPKSVHALYAEIGGVVLLDLLNRLVDTVHKKDKSSESFAFHFYLHFINSRYYITRLLICQHLFCTFFAYFYHYFDNFGILFDKIEKICYY